MEFSHIPVLLEETIEGLNIKENGIYVDGTAGGGGHSGAILKRLTTGKLISIDQDPDAIRTLTEKFKKNENAIIIKGNFGDMKDWTSAFPPTSSTPPRAAFPSTRTRRSTCA